MKTFFSSLLSAMLGIIIYTSIQRHPTPQPTQHIVMTVPEADWRLNVQTQEHEICNKSLYGCIWTPVQQFPSPGTQVLSVKVINQNQLQVTWK
ncbi:hypothetical protein [Delftia phage PhiW-14]|uniref:Uncharacterized protein n=1 Tax=Delftia phage PhiW-14 TaxID=665032 RepID=C9DG82_BPW14|nr:hypothetical protein DP-phiW-14_gp112 [Delftia phage PhiW-14]ACV50133.1 hypothetical protein [Delftia phage PhiW-14]